MLIEFDELYQETKAMQPKNDEEKNDRYRALLVTHEIRQIRSREFMRGLIDSLVECYNRQFNRPKGKK